MRYVPREYNERADALTHRARDEGDIYSRVEQTWPCWALRGAWDGGVDQRRSASAWWLEQLVAGRSEPRWELRQVEAIMQEPPQTVTAEELRGAAGLVKAMVQALEESFNYRHCAAKRRRV